MLRHVKPKWQPLQETEPFLAKSSMEFFGILKNASAIAAAAVVLFAGIVATITVHLFLSKMVCLHANDSDATTSASFLSVGLLSHLVFADSPGV